MSKTRLFLVRHAVAAPHPNIAEQDWPLTDAGQTQARNLAILLGNEPVDAIWSSPYQRSVDTVAPLSDHLSCDVQTHEGLRERRWSDAWLEDFLPYLERSFKEPDFKLPGGETAREALYRFEAALIEIAIAVDGAPTVVGTHGNVLSLFLRSLDPRVDFEFWKNLPHASVFRVDWDGCFRWHR
ncbi:MAG: histidine phosphatase family protein [Parvibaculaceae bacterium]|nr:histidine phosphatase family protein [Parvibaculaceae bacterium]HBM88172.1 histidine phosphatase family protein [Rhodobiaceae bacterium]